jgi:hypothetical protein
MIARFTSSRADRALPGSIDDITRLDADIIAHCKAIAPSGLAAAIDLGGCDPQAIRDARHTNASRSHCATCANEIIIATKGG